MNSDQNSNKRRSRSVLAGLALATGLAFSACSSPEPPQNTEDIRVYEGGHGRIQDIVADGNMVIIVHDEIPGFMMAMTMPFGIRADSVRSAIAVGDSIAFDVSTDGIDNWISRVEVVE